MAGEGAVGLEYKMAVELLPEIPEPSFAATSLTHSKRVVQVPDQDVDRAIERIAEQQRKSEVVERPAELGDIVVVILRARSARRRSRVPAAGSTDRA
jgi:FKBP-type peptidyl-prolyl cis-trans isomerase (trigger factor)